MIKYAICCLGCKVNTYEAESISASLADKGYKKVEFKEKADVYCIFTCAVTNTAASKSRQKISQAIRQNEKAVICVVGCYVQLHADKMAEDQRIDILVGSASKNRIPELIEKALQDHQRSFLVEDIQQHDISFETMPLERFKRQTRAYLKIQDGCNQYCSYCIIPYARGRERSMKLDEAVLQAKKLAENHSEIVLAGIHTGRYGQGSNISLTQLIQHLLQETTIKRIRISSIEVTEVTTDLIALMKSDQRIARHLHIPLQSGCDETLKRMKRPYTIKQFLEQVEIIRDALPDISISTDLIVGFCGETESEFLSTIQFLHQVQFSFLHVFPFSMKDGTAASLMTEHVSSEIQKQRVQQCLTLSKNFEYQYRTKFLSKPLTVLVEGNKAGMSYGYSSEYIPIQIEAEYPIGSLVSVVGSHMLQEELVGKESFDETFKII